MSGSVLAITLLGLVTSGCDGSILTLDPVQKAMRERLGPENPAVRIGPLHRPGQPCSLCHTGSGDAPAFSVSGTVYRDNQSAVALADVIVQMIDIQGAKFSTRTNCAGNFWLTPREFAPRWPVWVTLELGENKIDMESPIGREASCAACHLDPPGQASAGRVFLTDDPVVVPTITPRPCNPEELK
jgi:hypothetical protein